MPGIQSSNIHQFFEDRAKRLGIDSQRIDEARNDKESRLYSLLKGKPFWYSFNKDSHQTEFLRTGGCCCYMHIVGLFKNSKGEPCPIHKWQGDIILSALQSHKYIMWKKSVGIGATSLLLAYASWLCTRDDELKGKEIAVVVGPNLFLAQGLIARVRQPYLDRGIILQGNATSLVLNGCRWTAFPSNHLDSMRSRIDLKGIMIDEGDFFSQDRSIVRDVSERYISKSDPFIWLVSTVAKSHGLFYQIERESQSTCLYHRITTDYKYGLGTLYDSESVERMKLSSPSFAREMECQYSGAEGNVFSGKSIDEAVAAGVNIDLAQAFKSPNQKYVGIDVGFGSSATAITVTQISDNQDKVEVIYSREYERPTLGQIITEVMNIRRGFRNVQKIFVDDSSPVVIRELKLEFGERQDWTTELAELHEQYGMTDERIIRDCDWLTVFPVNFRQTRKEMLWRVKRLFDTNLIAIPDKFERLLISCRTAVAIDGSLDKSSGATEFSDSLDSLQLSCCGYSIIGKASEDSTTQQQDLDEFVKQAIGQ